MASVAVGSVGLKIVDDPVLVFELSLKQNIGSDRRGGIVVDSRMLVAERDLEIPVVELADGDVAGVKAQETSVPRITPVRCGT